MKRKSYALLLLAITLAGACKKEQTKSQKEVVTQETGKSSFTNENNQFRFMKKMPQPEVGITTKPTDSKNARTAGTGCTVTQVTKTAGYDENILLNPNSDIIYLGSIIDPQTINTGAYKPITNVTRKPITVSTSLQGVQGVVSKTFMPSLSNQRTALNEILNQKITGDQPGELSMEINEVYSEDQMKLAIGTKFEYSKIASITANLNFSESAAKTHIVAKFIQTYYTTDMDIPSDGKLIEDDPSKFGQYSPVYVSSCTYGRMGLFFFESSKSSKEVTAALNATYKAAVVSGSVDVSLETKKILNESTIKVYTNGGSGADAVLSIGGYEGFVAFVKQGGKYSINSRGAMLSFRLRYLSDHSIARTVLTSTYNVRTCDETKVPVYSFKNSQYGDHYLSVVSNAGNYWTYEGTAFYAHKIAVDGAYPVYVYVNDADSDHYYTTGGVSGNWWRNEGVAFYAYKTQVEGTIPIYEFYSASGKEHYYTPSQSIGSYPGYWSANNGVVFYVFPNGN
ncbi:thiol-activated cytolysin family protein [Chitinophaga sp. OAE865]|uniref:thiol-activated cytolysin family protein n=1 Tax=Chitinophaga sp. OAE865 TaxID=2817898 RepID=UPI001AE6A58E